ncbi:hypothetical protein SAMN05660297_03113 [Natronincola peptidivorans]|uniref:Zinc-ribbon domain-containing protein n=1 Tax=Natronincola peptidivorans TaxID=426128 RepID=A0A1I0G9A6_9FIRM|nr:hypothetical protein [Natronincola peptidivorans]SET67596.1 hypothetical protein SAMN05660297_03113 [Natronincola peptidivorans]
MNIIDKLSDAVSQSVEQLGKKSSEIIEVNKLNLNISKREREIQGLYEELGRHVYQHLRGENYINVQDLDKYFDQINYLQNDIETLRRLVIKIQRIKYCSKCKEEFDEEIVYCPLCGKYIREQ